MCGINIFNKTNLNIDIINNLCSKRGPDEMNIKKINNVYFIHNLLHITGEKTLQPFVDNEIVCLFNGEIYNYLQFNKNYKTDGECLIPLYKEFDIEFTKKLDGEFAICLIDFEKNIIIISTDAFSTKPLYYSFEDKHFMISSLGECIRKAEFKNIHKLPPNKTLKFDLNNFNKISETNVFTFELKQYKKDFNDWNKAFENAILKRTKNKKFYVCMSSGMDSGAICCVLNKYNIPYETYTIRGSENYSIICKRNEINKVKNKVKNNLFNLNSNDKKTHYDFIQLNCDDFSCRNPPYSVKKDKASIGCSYISNLANKKYKIHISGQGADEVLSDYGFNGRKLKRHSCFGGKFPEDLSKIFPWKSIYGGLGQCLLMKEEFIAGSYGIENRYPFLDKNLVQEFLWLDHNLKNSKYKAPLNNYLDINNYPYEKRLIKIGFDP